ncbi:MAG: YbhN family protein [Parafannyhessea sp.]|uniref:lysylphosphatidylglycerol synthase transmembrane domain-containing protein n=1 Tax=Parafannyhessea sp. TaxID=2847324 RepID=UPI003EFE3E72
MAKADDTKTGSATKASAGSAPKASVHKHAGHPSSKPKLKVSTGHIQAEGNEDQKASARKGALFLAGVVALYVVYLIFSGQMVQFLDALSTVDTHWVWLACLCYVFYFIFGVLAYVIAVFIDHDSPVGVRDLMSVEASGVFFGNLTPMMAGSVPSQIVRLTKTGLDPGEASATQFTRFIMFQFGVVLFAAIMLAAKLEFFFETYGDIIILNIVVFGVHMLELIALFVICLCPRFVMRVGMAVIRFCKRVNILKKQEDVDHWTDVVNVQVKQFSDAFKTAAKDWPSMLLTLAVTMAQLASLYMIPWFVLNAFGVQADFLDCLAAGSMVQMVSSAVPLPGGTGGAEGGFFMFYGGLFGTSATAGYLIWRLITFIAPTILAAPLLSLKTTNRTRSIYQRWQDLTHGSSRSAGVSMSGATIKRRVAQEKRSTQKKKH